MYFIYNSQYLNECDKYHREKYVIHITVLFINRICLLVKVQSELRIFII